MGKTITKICVKKTKYGGSLFTRGGGELGQSESVLNINVFFLNMAFDKGGGGQQQNQFDNFVFLFLSSNFEYCI